MVTTLRFIAIFLITTVAATVRGQVVLPERGAETGLRQGVFGVGLGAGAMSGIGLSFRHHLASTFSYQVTGGIIKSDNRISSAVGAEGQVDLVRSPATRFFVGGGLGYYYSGRSGSNDMAAPWRAGLGIGGEFSSGGGFHFSVELMFTYFSDGNVLPLPQAGFCYYFY